MTNFYRDESGGQKKICLATTTYGDPDSSYVFSIQDSREALHKAGFRTDYFLLQGNCHVDDARNDIVRAFLRTDCTDLVFIDADVSWRAADLVKLCKYDLPIVGGVYPYRRDNPDAIPARLMAGAEPVNGLLEVEGLPTGFLKISRATLEQMCRHAPAYQHEGQTTHILFERVLVNGTRWGGDLHFCNMWRSLGGKIYADMEMVLGHAGRTITYGSLGTYLRKRDHSTLRYVADKVRAGTWTIHDMKEAFSYCENRWGAPPEVLAAAVTMAGKADGPIVETGSGLTSVLMAAATSQTVYCLEHSDVWAMRLRELADMAGVQNIGICRVPITNGWYDLSEFRGLPKEFSLGLNDGPPRTLSDRMKFFEHLQCKAIICDDAQGYIEPLRIIAKERGMAIDIVERMAVLR